ncbi:hypothetical protein CROQUDRAFT_91460 [Cronartium quercuum f. sp. fusiforme G11]|uniref:Uncharacterized protein n=1 Tax=Cronartium quercuum f. sp. fusiforme G11 TaxID=708437 RepID=A0A9P6NI44_9BASI|nr:hypothetical protein CROQUDRAFT_91460 [Cronartium quercuum f. sp. fusiforme G11]
MIGHLPETYPTRVLLTGQRSLTEPIQVNRITLNPFGSRSGRWRHPIHVRNTLPRWTRCPVSVLLHSGESHPQPSSVFCSGHGYDHLPSTLLFYKLDVLVLSDYFDYYHFGYLILFIDDYTFILPSLVLHILLFQSPRHPISATDFETIRDDN